MIVAQDQSAVDSNRIRQLIVKAGDEGCDYFKRDLTKLTDELAEYYQQTRLDLRETIVKVMCEAISLFPLKSGIYATLVSLLSIRSSTSALSETIVQNVFDRLASLWQEAHPIIGKNIMGFLGELMNIGLLNSVNYIECLYDLESGAEAEKYPFYLSILLSTLPHIMVRATEKNQIEFKNIIQNIDNLMGKRDKVAEIDELDLLWMATRQFLNSADQTSFLQKSYPRPYFLFPEEMTQVKQIRKNFKIVVNKREKGWHPQQILIFAKEGMQNDAKVFMMQEILRQWIHETLMLFRSNKLLLVLQFEHYSKFMGLSPIQETTLKRLTTQTLINQMIDLKPNDPTPILYSSLLASLAQRENKNEFLEYVEQCVDEVLIRQGDNLVVLDLLAQFLSHFLANISLKWNWEKMFSLVNGESGEVTYAKHYFVYVFLEKFFGMIQVAKIADLISKDLLQWFETFPDPRKPNQEARFDSAESMLQLLNSKAPASQVAEELSANNQYEKNLNLFSESLLQRMSASITHLSVLSRRYQTLYTQPAQISQEASAHILLDNLFHTWGLPLRVFLTGHLQIFIPGCMAYFEISPSGDALEIDQQQESTNLFIALLNLLRQVYSNLKLNILDDYQLEDIDGPTCLQIAQSLERTHISIAQKIQLYLLAILSLRRIDANSVMKTVKNETKYQREYSASVILHL